MALTATTTLGATDYTPKASFASSSYLSDGWYTDPLKIKRSITGSAIDYHNHRSTSYTNKYFDVREIIDYDYAGTNQWCREYFSNDWAFCGYKTTANQYWVTLNGTVSCTYGQIRITSGTVTATRETASTKKVTVSATLNYQIAQAPIESYYSWQVYAYIQGPNGVGEKQSYLFNTSKSWSTGTGSKTITFEFDDDSGNTSISAGNYGIWGNNAYSTGHTHKQERSMGVGKEWTINIPAYSAYTSPVKQYNGSSWDEITIRNGTTTDILPIKQYNGSSWVDL